MKRDFASQSLGCGVLAVKMDTNSKAMEAIRQEIRKQMKVRYKALWDLLILEYEFNQILKK